MSGLKGNQLKWHPKHVWKSHEEMAGMGVSSPLTKVATVSHFPFIYGPLDTIFTDAMPLKCEGMYRGVIGKDGDAKVAIFHDNVLT